MSFFDSSGAVLGYGSARSGTLVDDARQMQQMMAEWDPQVVGQVLWGGGFAEVSNAGPDLMDSSGSIAKQSSRAY